jgi:hypothetical protein
LRRKLTAKRQRRLLIPAQGWHNPGDKEQTHDSTLKALALVVSERFQRWQLYAHKSQGCRCAPNPGLKLANAFGVQVEHFPFELEHFPFELEHFLF